MSGARTSSASASAFRLRGRDQMAEREGQCTDRQPMCFEQHIAQRAKCDNDRDHPTRDVPRLQSAPERE